MKANTARALWFAVALGGLSLAGAAAANAATADPTSPSSDASNPAGTSTVSSLVANNGPVDATAGDAVVDSIVGGANSAVAPVTGAVAQATGGTAVPQLVDSLVGAGSAAADVPGDGSLVDGGTVGDAAANLDGVLNAAASGGDVPGAVADTVTGATNDVNRTVSDAQADSTQLLGSDGIGPTATSDAATTVADALAGGPATGGDVAQTVNDALTGTADTTDSIGLTDDALADTLGATTASSAEPGTDTVPGDDAAAVLAPVIDTGLADGTAGLLAGTDTTPLEDLTGSDSPVDTVAGDELLDPALGSDSQLPATVAPVSEAADTLTGTTAASDVVDAALGEDSGLNDIAGDGTLVEGGLVGDATANTDAVIADLGSGDPAAADLGNDVNGIANDLSTTAQDAAANLDGQVANGLAADAATDAAAIVTDVLAGGDVADGLRGTVTDAGANASDAVDSTGLTDDAAADLLGDGGATAPVGGATAATEPASGALDDGIVDPVLGAGNPVDQLTDDGNVLEEITQPGTGVLDRTVGDPVVDPAVGADSPVDPALGDPSPIADASGDASAVNDIAGDGALVEGGLVGDTATDVDDLLADVESGGDPVADAADAGGLLDDDAADIAATVDDALAGTARAVRHAGLALRSGTLVGLQDLVNGDLTTQSGLADPVLADLLGDTDPAATPGGGTTGTGTGTGAGAGTGTDTGTDTGAGTDTGIAAGGTPGATVAGAAGIRLAGLVTSTGALNAPLGTGPTAAAADTTAGELATTGTNLGSGLASALTLLMIGALALLLRRKEQHADPARR
jgi:hypothetical protein